ncbi:malate:quinone oxidoreductase [Segetibacter sp. 3557_3]|uniref:malate:quinone oxidoreductase n=1 Tax=Segetibacter sp. 3557_3 TaxID=2547429 RepID=UPI001058F549|nr:malate:quinone oxidoreductase [Segetibacter sp. 3557_3]TDH24234.1 malate:quinone oxidoreductase [Segetibacter sp. 3557_3]
MAETNTTETDVLLIGAGIMSATLGTILKQLEPGMTMQIFERLDNAAAESSDAWNNAGTGHSAFCELNYTPQKEDGSIDTTKAVKIAESFEVSKQWWTYLLEQNLIDVPESFIKPIPHMSFVWGNENVQYLRKRYEALTSCHLFRGMEYSEDFEKLHEWMPLVMNGRDRNTPVAATRMDIGTDVNFGSLTRCLFKMLSKSKGVSLHYNHEVRRLRQDRKGRWQVRVRDINTGEVRKVVAKFVFIGAGGGALPLLLKSGIPEGKGFGGFPVSGQWLRCTNPAVIGQHDAKVYGLAAVGSPPMSVPHLDSRYIKGRKELLFGPYAGFTTKFLKEGSFFDLIKSIRFSNIYPMLAAGVRNIPLTRYLINQVRLTPESRLDLLREYVPSAKLEDWALEVAGQRVQVIKKDEEEGGILEFGTEVVSAADGSLASLLGASPGASTAVSIMLSLIKKCFTDKYTTPEWQLKLKKMVPSFGESLGSNAELLHRVRTHSNEVLGID